MNKLPSSSFQNPKNNPLPPMNKWYINITAVFFILGTAPAFCTPLCNHIKTGYGETRTKPCLCTGGPAVHSDRRGGDTVCALGQACHKGVYDDQTRNGTDAVCSAPVPCTDTDNTTPPGCIPSLCVTPNGGMVNNCRAPTCANTKGTMINPTICVCPGVDNWCSGRSRYCLSTGLSDTNARCFRACKTLDSSVCMCLTSATYPNPHPEEIGEVCNADETKTYSDIETCDRETKTCVKDIAYEDSDDYKTSQTVLIVSIVCAILTVPLLVWSVWNIKKMEQKNQRESHIVSISLGGSCCVSCCCSYRFNAPHVYRNRHLLAHGLSPQAIQEKFEAMNTFMSSSESNFIAPTFPMYKHKKQWIRPLDDFVSEEGEGGLFMNWVDRGILVCPPRAQSSIVRAMRGRRRLVHRLSMNIVPCPQYERHYGVVGVVPANNPGNAIMEIREFR